MNWFRPLSSVEGGPVARETTQESEHQFPVFLNQTKSARAPGACTSEIGPILSIRVISDYIGVQIDLNRSITTTDKESQLAAMEISATEQTSGAAQVLIGADKGPIVKTVMMMTLVRVRPWWSWGWKVCWGRLFVRGACKGVCGHRVIASR